MVEVLAAVAVLVAGVSALWPVMRASRLARLRGEVRGPLGQADARGAPAQARRGQHARLGALVNAGARSGATAAGVVWQ